MARKRAFLKPDYMKCLKEKLTHLRRGIAISGQPDEPDEAQTVSVICHIDMTFPMDRLAIV